MAPSPTDSLLQQVLSSGKKWIIIVDDKDNVPKVVLDSDSFLRDALYKRLSFNPLLYCHRPIIVKDPRARLGEIVPLLKVHPQRSEDDVIDLDIILFWGDEKKVITGADILGRLLRGIVDSQHVVFRKGR